jgi:hypothetical protein
LDWKRSYSEVEKKQKKKIEAKAKDDLTMIFLSVRAVFPFMLSKAMSKSKGKK